MPCIHSIQRSDSGHSIHARMPRSDAGNAEQVPLIRGAEKGCYLVTETEATRANKYLDKKACIGLEAMHLRGAVPFFDSPTASFSLLVKQRCMTT